MVNLKMLFNDVQINRICELYINNKSAVYISKLFRCSDSTIKNYLKRRGIKLRTKREYMKLVESKTRFKKGQKSPNYKNGRCIKQGYIFIYVPNKGYIQEHRLVMEKHLGRKLKSNERIHHIDFDKTNNKIENLYLFQNSISHNKYHRLLRNSVMKILGKNWQQNENGSGKVRFIGDRNFKEYGRCRVHEIYKRLCKEIDLLK